MCRLMMAWFSGLAEHELQHEIEVAFRLFDLDGGGALDR
jgi:Ca2+-binding EF-hand superfamily protein